jgi:hypothetical protein
MNDIQPTNPTALSRSGPINPTTLLCMIAKTDKVVLTGFNQPHTNWFAPGVRFIGMTKTGRHDIGAELARQAVRTRRMLIVAAALVATALVLGALLVAKMSNFEPDKVEVRAISWHAYKIEAAGVWIRSGSNSVFVPIGGRLPNGELLVSANPPRNAYSTPSGVTTIGTTQ